MATIQEIRDEIENLLWRFGKLERLPLELRTLRDQGNLSLETLRARSMKEHPRDYGVDIVRAIVDLEIGRHRIMKGAGLEDDADLDDWREAANEAVARAKAWLGRARGRDLSGEAKRNVAELQRNIRRLEESMRFLDHPEPHMEMVRELTEEISGQIAALEALPGGEKALGDFVRYFEREMSKHRARKLPPRGQE